MKEREIVKRVASKLVRAMAYKRRDFINKVQEYVGGAYLEFYKQRLATKNDQTEWVKHWQTEVKNLLERALFAALIHPVRGFSDRQKAFDAAMAELRANDSKYRAGAEYIVRRDFKMSKLRVKLDDKDEEDFWAQVTEAANPALKGETK